MSAAKYTPGPWQVNTAGSAKRGEPFKVTEIYVYAPNTQDDTAICADVIDPVTQEPSEANARLIAAAPELLDALQSFLRAPSTGSAGPGAITIAVQDFNLRAARAAIAKATTPT